MKKMSKMAKMMKMAMGKKKMKAGGSKKGLEALVKEAAKMGIKAKRGTETKLLPKMTEGGMMDMSKPMEARMGMAMDYMKRGGTKMELPKRGMRMGGHVKRKKKGMMKGKKKGSKQGVADKQEQLHILNNKP